MPLAGGIWRHGYQCGMLWGSTLAAGAQSFRLHDPGPRAEAAAILAAQKIVDSFHARHKSINCLEMSGHTFECRGIVGRRFESVADRARHLAGGGCPDVLDVLATLEEES